MRGDWCQRINPSFRFFASSSHDGVLVSRADNVWGPWGRPDRRETGQRAGCKQIRVEMRQPGQGLCHATAMQGVQRPSLDPEGQADRVEAGLTWLHSVFFCISFAFFSVVHRQCMCQNQPHAGPTAISGVTRDESLLGDNNSEGDLRMIRHRRKLIPDEPSAEGILIQHGPPYYIVQYVL